ncbi:hypothetical protein ACFQ0B_10380 [Nonomuraea thailandensis]
MVCRLLEYAFAMSAPPPSRGSRPKPARSSPTAIRHGLRGGRAGGGCGQGAYGGG